MDPTIKDFKFLFNTNSRENSEMTIDTARVINNELNSQITETLDELKENLLSLFQEAINAAIAEKLLSYYSKHLTNSRFGCYD